jgi:hypothetical protein
VSQLALALEGRRDGLDKVEISSADWLKAARAEAVRVCQERGEVHVDDVRSWSIREDLPAPSKHCWGAVFRNGFVAIGLKPSLWPSNHGHRSPVWRLA